MTHVVNPHTQLRLDTAPWIRIFPVRTPTLPPATHTNVYLLEADDGYVVIDPASPYDDEQRALEEWLRTLDKPVVEIVLTHHHVDHMSGAQQLAHRLGVGVAAHAETRRAWGARAGDAHHQRGRVDRGELSRAAHARPRARPSVLP